MKTVVTSRCLHRSHGRFPSPALALCFSVLVWSVNPSAHAETAAGTALRLDGVNDLPADCQTREGREHQGKLGPPLSAIPVTDAYRPGRVKHDKDSDNDGPQSVTEDQEMEEHG